MPLRASSNAVLDLVLPSRCVGCGCPGATFCAACMPAGPVRWVEGTHLRTAAAAGYDGAVRAALLRYKERGRRDLGPPLARLLARSLTAVLDDEPGPPGRWMLVSVPSSPRAAAARGGDHVLRLARQAGRRVGLPVQPALAIGRPVADSAGLGALERAGNLDHAFAARHPASGSGAVAVVVDDIVTTGATLREARRALSAAGWTVIGAAVVAETAPRRSAGGPRAATRPC